MRNGNTYRSSRRNEWRALVGASPWREWNAYDTGDHYAVGKRSAPRRFGHVARSKYMPHIGAKERGRYA